MGETDHDEAGFAAAGAFTACFLCLCLGLAADAGTAGVAGVAAMTAGVAGIAGVAGVAAGAWAYVPNEKAATTTAAMIFFMMGRFLEEVGEQSDSMASVHSTVPL